MTSLTPAAILGKVLEGVAVNRGKQVHLAQRAGLKLGRITKAIKGYPLGASDHLRLCAAMNMDPATGTRSEAPEPGDFDFKALGVGVAMSRIQRGHDKSIRRTAAAIGVVHSTFLKIERGEVTSIASVLAACRYVGLSPFHYVKHPRFTANNDLTSLTSQDNRSAA